MPEASVITPLYFADLTFEAVKTIRSLPVWHAGRWAAWLRFACHDAGVDWQQFFFGLIPRRNGQNAVLRGEHLHLRLILLPAGPGQLTKVTAALCGQCGKVTDRGEFGPDSLRLIKIKDALSGRVLYQERTRPLPDGGAEMVPLSEGIITPFIRRLTSTDHFDLQIRQPLRLTAPPDAAGWNHETRGRYCGPEFFSRDSRAFGRILEFVRGLPRETVSTGVKILKADLDWSDLRYSRDREIKIGGVTGRLRCAGVLSEAAAFRLVTGQYTGTGKGPRFGTGWYDIPLLSS